MNDLVKLKEISIYFQKNFTKFLEKFSKNSVQFHRILSNLAENLFQRRYLKNFNVLLKKFPQIFREFKLF